MDPEAGIVRLVRSRHLWEESAPKWCPCLRVSDIRVRGLYAMKDTYISTALTAGVNTMWLEAQTGVRYETMKRH